MSQTLIDALVRARREHQALSAADWADSLRSAEQAYAVQDGVAAAMGWFEGLAPQRWKSGGASRDVVLTHAALPPSGVRASPADLRDLPWHSRGIEAEIALRLGRAVTPDAAAGLALDHVDELIDAMAVSIEVCDSRWREGGAAPALLRLADLQSHGALALGPWRPYARRDWAAQACEVRIGSHAPVVRVGSHSLADPAWLLPTWLRHATRHGATLPAGTVVTTGTWCGMLPAQAGNRVVVDFAGIGGASLQL